MEHQAGTSLTPGIYILEKASLPPASQPAIACKEEPTPIPPQLFRPINFESTPPTTPEGLESNGSKSTLGNGSESGSDCAMDSAYSSDATKSDENSQLQLARKKISASLQNKCLWRSFKRLGNEMIVTKPGR